MVSEEEHLEHSLLKSSRIFQGTGECRKIPCTFVEDKFVSIPSVEKTED